jgi:hypothetical protein
MALRFIAMARRCVPYRRCKTPLEKPRTRRARSRFPAPGRKSGGGHLRIRSEKNTIQHQAFLDEYESNPHDWAETIEWFKTFPLWLDLDGLRVIHACWERDSVDRILELQNGSNLLSDELLHASAERSTWQFKAVETLLKGKEIPLPDGTHFHDKDGNKRHNIRIRWWDTADTYRDTFMGPESTRTRRSNRR